MRTLLSCILLSSRVMFSKGGTLRFISSFEVQETLISKASYSATLSNVMFLK